MSGHVPILDPLRGIAALSVCLFHFTNGNDSLLANGNWLKTICSYGYAGVGIFFVVSGFVISHALTKRQHTLKDAPEFLIRRFKRLHPPYIVSIAVVLLLHSIVAATPWFQGKPPVYDLKQLLTHFIYASEFFGFDWLNPVYWTLGIEVQFYIWIAVLFPLYNNENKTAFFIMLFATSMLSLVPLSADMWVFKWLPLFCVGILMSKTKRSDYLRPAYITSLLAIIVLSICAVGIVHTTAGGLTMVAILVFEERKLPAVFLPISGLGLISYSLYLLHVPIGGRVVNVATRLRELPIYSELFVLVAICSSLITAWIYWKVVELPSQNWAKLTFRFAKSETASESGK